MWSAASRYLARQDRDVCTTGRRQFDYLYAYLLDACHIADSDHSSVIEHAQRGISFSARLYWLRIFFSLRRVRGFDRWPIDASIVKEDTSPRFRKKEKWKLVLHIFFLLLYIYRDHPVGISDATDSAIAFRCAWVPSISSRHDVLWRYYWHFVLPTSKIRFPSLFLPCSVSAPKRRGRTCARPREYPWHNRYLHRAGLLIHRGIPPSRWVDIYSILATRQVHTSCQHRNEAIGSYFLCARLVALYITCFSKASTFVISDLLSHVIVARDIKLLINEKDLQICRL